MPLTGAAPIDIMALNESTCRWPVRQNPWNDAGPWLFCGHDVMRGAYCRKHGSMAYRSVAGDETPAAIKSASQSRIGPTPTSR